MLTAEQVQRLQTEPIKSQNRLGAAMRIADLTQVQLAERAGLTQSMVSLILNGKTPRLPLDSARRIAQVFGCAIEDIFPAREPESEVA